MSVRFARRVALRGVARHAFLGSAGIVLALLPGVAWADESGDASEPAPGVAVRIGSVRPGTSVAIETTGDDGAVARVVSRCFDDCEEVLDPGPYRLRLIGADGETVGTKSVSIRRPITFHVRDTSPGVATTGLVLGISGGVLLVTGIFALTSTLSSDGVTGQPNGPPAWVGAYGLAATTVGILMTSFGWAMFAHNRRLFSSETVKERTRHVDHDAALNPRVGIVPCAQGVSAGLTLAF